MTNPPVHYRTFVYDSARWSGVRLRDDDIVISTPPKCGTTWTQRICALLLFQTPQLEKPLTRYSPWVDMLDRPLDELQAEIEAQRHRRFLKTHTPFDGLPFDDRVTWVCVGRDPRDVALSWDGHVANTDLFSVLAARDRAVGNADIAGMLEQGLPPVPESPRDRFWAWMRNETPPTEDSASLRATVHHLASFWKERHRPNVVMLHYADLKADLEGNMRVLASRLGIAVPEGKWPALVQAATFEEMKREADRTAPNVTEALWQDNRAFFRSGEVGQWQAMFGEGDDARYDALVRSMADEDLLAWMHFGAAGAAGRAS